MSKRFYFLSLVLALLLPMAANATHIVGGEMTYKCLGNNLYEIKLTIFRDCYNGEPWFDDPAAIGIFANESNQLLDSILIPLDSMLNDTLDPTLDNDCFVIPPNVCVHTTTYTTTRTLPFIAGGYYLVYQRCCRNHTITNLVAPEDVGATYGIQLNEFALQQCNNSPVFNNWPPLYLCVNQPFNIDQSAVDLDGDSLVYKLCNPLTGATPQTPMPQPPNPPPYFTVPWLAPYQMTNQIGGPPYMEIDPVTGLLTGLPNVIGQFVIGICVEEYRNGQLIGTNRRDYQVNIGVCAETTASFFTPSIQCNGLTVDLQNQSTNADEFLWLFNDPGNPGASSSLANPVYTYSDTGLYQITLIAEPGTNCTDTFTTNIHFLANSLFANFAVSDLDCEEEFTMSITDSSVDTLSSISTWAWTLTQGTTVLQSNEQSPSFTLTQPGPAVLTLIVTAENGCKDTLQQPFPVVIFNDTALEDSLAFCLTNGAVPLNPDSAFFGAVFQWMPPDGLDDPTSVNPSANPAVSTAYHVLLTDVTGFCEAERTVIINLPPDVTVTPSLDTIGLGESVQILASYDPSYTYVWTPVEGLDNANIHNPLASPNQSMGYLLTVIDSNGCFVERDVLIVLTTICEEPFIFIPTGFTPNGDGKNDVFKIFGNNLTDTQLVVYDRWGEKVFESNDQAVGWDGSFNGKQLPPDVYGFYAIVRCENGESFSKKGNVTLMR
ncbi:MAG: gliding motility-associated C-terminal domain-containing protein [Saprospiraceae bacterium]|nr:gliding motility-associated C-terminal domain-containing protein [Saprospiraceae bacterium]